MKTYFLALLGLAASATATPILDSLDLELPNPAQSGLISARGPFKFDYTVNVLARPRQVVNSDGKKTGGLKGSTGRYRLGFRASENVVCYNITHFGFTGQYSSPARTATHLHEAAKGSAGPPRLAFPNPKGNNKRRNTVGCMKGPFRTGLDDDQGNDTGAGFHVRQIINAPRGFFVDAHSTKALDGAFRGQLPRKNA